MCIQLICRDCACDLAYWKHYKPCRRRDRSGFVAWGERRCEFLERRSVQSGEHYKERCAACALAYVSRKKDVPISQSVDEMCGLPTIGPSLDDLNESIATVTLPPQRDLPPTVDLKLDQRRVTLRGGHGSDDTATNEALQNPVSRHETTQDTASAASEVSTNRSLASTNTDQFDVKIKEEDLDDEVQILSWTTCDRKSESSDSQSASTDSSLERTRQIMQKSPSREDPWPSVESAFILPPSPKKVVARIRGPLYKDNGCERYRLKAPKGSDSSDSGPEFSALGDTGLQHFHSPKEIQQPYPVQDSSAASGPTPSIPLLVQGPLTPDPGSHLAQHRPYVASRPVVQYEVASLTNLHTQPMPPPTPLNPPPFVTGQAIRGPRTRIGPRGLPQLIDRSPQNAPQDLPESDIRQKGCDRGALPFRDASVSSPYLHSEDRDHGQPSPTKKRRQQ